MSGSCRPFSKCVGQFGLQMCIANAMAFCSQKSNAFKCLKCLQVNPSVFAIKHCIVLQICPFKHPGLFWFPKHDW